MKDKFKKILRPLIMAVAVLAGAPLVSGFAGRWLAFPILSTEVPWLGITILTTAAGAVVAALTEMALNKWM